MKLCALLFGITALVYGQPAPLIVSSNPNPSAFAQTVTLSASNAPSGLQVSFFEGNPDIPSTQIFLGSGTSNSSGAASFPISTLSVGPHTIFAEYTINAVTFVSSTIIQTVTKATPTITFTANPSTVNAGAGTVVLRATFAPSQATGTVTFSDSTTFTTFPPGAIAVSSGQANVSINIPTQPGNHTLVATYSGDSNFNATQVQTTLVVNVTTTTTISATPTAPVFGQTVNISATVAPATATGQVQFFDGTTSLGQGTLANGSASLPPITGLAVGTHSLTASYLGNSNFPTSTSSPLALTVGKAPTTTSLIAGPNPANLGQTVALTATVRSATSSPAGTVTFFDGTTQLNTATLVNGSATFSSSSFISGSHSLTATYNGDGNDATSTSSPVSLAVNASISLAVSPNPATLGQQVTLTATVPVVNSATLTVTFFDGTSQIGTVTASGTTATLQTSSLSVGTHTLTATLGNATSNAVSEVIT